MLPVVSDSHATARSGEIRLNSAENGETHPAQMNPSTRGRERRIRNGITTAGKACCTKDFLRHHGHFLGITLGITHAKNPAKFAYVFMAASLWASLLFWGVSIRLSPSLLTSDRSDMRRRSNANNSSLMGRTEG